MKSRKRLISIYRLKISPFFLLLVIGIYI